MPAVGQFLCSKLRSGHRRVLHTKRTLYAVTPAAELVMAVRPSLIECRRILKRERMKIWKTLFGRSAAHVAAANPYFAQAQSDAYGSWISKAAPFGVDGNACAVDGSIVAQAYGRPTWWRLVADIHGDYSNGTWTALPDMPAINHTYPVCAILITALRCFRTAA